MRSYSRTSLALVAISALPALSFGQDRGTATVASRAHRTVQAHLAAENAHDLTALVATLADTLELRVQQENGRDTTFKLVGEERRRNYERAFRAAPKSHFRVISEIDSGPWVITREEGSGLPIGRNEIGLNAYRVVGDRIVALWILNIETSVSR